MAYKLKSLNSCPQHPLTFHVSLGRWHSALWEETTLSAERHTFSNQLPFWPWLWHVCEFCPSSPPRPLFSGRSLVCLTLPCINLWKETEVTLGEEFVNFGLFCGVPVLGQPGLSGIHMLSAHKKFYVMVAYPRPLHKPCHSNRIATEIT